MARIIVEVTKGDGTIVTGDHTIEDDGKFKNQVDAFLRSRNYDTASMSQKKQLDAIAKELANFVHSEAKLQRSREKNVESSNEIDEELGVQDPVPEPPPA